MAAATLNAAQMPPSPFGQRDDRSKSSRASNNAGEAQSKNKDLFKTRMCTFFLQGTCTLETTCKFAHHASEMRAAPNLAKTQLCPKFLNGKCTNIHCSFAHGEAELVKPPSYKKKMCAWHREGKCRNGAMCGFAHSMSELSVEAQATEKEAWSTTPLGLDALGLKAKSTRAGDDGDASTAVPSSQSLADSDISMMGGSRAPDEHLFRMMAGRGSAPLQQQVASMTAAIGDLQTKLAQVEETALQTQVGTLKQTIAQLSEQCGDMEARLRSQQSAPPMVSETMPRPRVEMCGDFKKGLCTRGARCKFSHGKKGDAEKHRQTDYDDDHAVDKGIAGKKMQQAKTLVPWWDHTGVRATMGVLVLAMMVAVEFALKQ